MVISPASTREATARGPANDIAYCSSREVASRSSRSAKAPATGVRIDHRQHVGKGENAPSQVPDSVSSQASQRTAIRWIQVPSSEGMLDERVKAEVGIA